MASVEADLAHLVQEVLRIQRCATCARVAPQDESGGRSVFDDAHSTPCALDLQRPADRGTHHTRPEQPKFEMARGTSAILFGGVRVRVEDEDRALSLLPARLVFLGTEVGGAEVVSRRMADPKAATASARKEDPLTEYGMEGVGGSLARARHIESDVETEHGDTAVSD